MNANELANKAESMKKYGYTDGWIDEVAAKLRQQQADLKDADKYALELEKLYEDAKAEIEALKDKLMFKHQKEFDKHKDRPKEKRTIETLSNGCERHTHTYWDADSNGLVTASWIIKKAQE